MVVCQQVTVTMEKAWEAEEEGLQCEGCTGCFRSKDECRGPGTLEKPTSLCDRGRVCKRKQMEIGRPPSPSWVDKTFKVEDLERYLGNKWGVELGLGFCYTSCNIMRVH